LFTVEPDLLELTSSVALSAGVKLDGHLSAVRLDRAPRVL